MKNVKLRVATDKSFKQEEITLISGRFHFREHVFLYKTFWRYSSLSISNTCRRGRL